LVENIVLRLRTIFENCCVLVILKNVVVLKVTSIDGGREYSRSPLILI